MKNNPPAATRLSFVDNIRICAITLVIAHHSAQAYGPTGGLWPIANPLRTFLLAPFFPVNAAFLMGLLFLISGYFVAKSYERKGARAFLKGRFIRIGIPLLVFTLCVLGPITYLLEGRSRSFGEFVIFMYDSGWQIPYAHLWFLIHLLLYSLGYVLWRHIIRRDIYSKRLKLSVPGHRAILLLFVALALSSWIVRIWYPIDRWIPLFFVIPAEAAHLPQYIGLFSIGALAYRGDWLRRLRKATGYVWLGVGLAAAAARYAVQYSDALTGTRFLSVLTANGGWNVWEALICVGLCAGLLVLFREWFNKPQGKLLSAMAGASYGAYIVHFIFVLAVQGAFQSLKLPPFAKFVFITLIATVISFGISHLLRLIPGTKRFL